MPNVRALAMSFSTGVDLTLLRHVSFFTLRFVSLVAKPLRKNSCYDFLWKIQINKPWMLQRNRMCISMELVTAVLGDHGQRPRDDYGKVPKEIQQFHDIISLKMVICLGFRWSSVLFFIFS